MAHQECSAPLLYTNDALVGDAPLVWKTLMAHQTKGAPLVIIFFHFYINTNGASDRSAPLLVLTSNGASGKKCVSTEFFYSFFCKTTNGAPFHSAPLLV
mgnify:CR=1 FL=1